MHDVTGFKFCFFTFDLDVQHLRVNTEGQVAWQCPGRGRPGNQGHILIANQREVNDDRRILNVLDAKVRQ